MRKFNALLVSLLISSFCFGQTNLISSCLGNASTGATSVQNYWGWAYSGPGSPWWNVLDNTGGGIRFKTQTTAAISTGGTYTGRESLIRWDSPYNSAVANGTFSLGVGNGTNSTVTGISLTAGTPYTFSGLTEWFNNGNTPTITVQYSTAQFTSGISLGTVSPTTNAVGATASIKYYPFSFTFTPATTGTYFIQFTQTAGLVSNLGAILGLANLSLVANSTINVTGASNYVYTGSAQGPASVSRTGSSGAVTYSYVGVNGTSYTASSTPPTAVGSYTTTATVAADATYNGATSSAYPFTISIFSNTPTSNLIPNCLGSVAASVQNTCGWAYSGPNAGPWWNTLNSTQGLRFKDQSNAAINGGGTYTGRESLIRWDSPYNSAGASGTFSLGVGDGSTTTATGISLIGGTLYTFSGLAEWYNGGDLPTFSVQYSIAQFSSGTTFGTIALTWNSSTLGLKYFPFSMTFTPATTGTYFIQFTQTAGLVSNAGGMLGLANLSLTPTSTISVTGTNNYVYTGSAQGPASVSHTGSAGTVTLSYVGVNGTTYTASPTPPTAVGSYTVTATVAADATYSGASSSAYPFAIHPVVSTFSKSGTSNWSTATEWTYIPLAGTDLVIASGELVVDQTPISVNSITVNGGAKLTLNNNVSLTVGALNLLSDPTFGTGTFVDQNTNGGLTVTGTTTVNQSLQAASALRTWYITPPVASATPTPALSIIKYFDETLNTGTPADNWVSSVSMVAKKGYQVVPVTGNDISFSGTLNNGDQNISLTSRAGADNYAGFNLIGNPYPSYLDWSLVTANTSNAALMRSTTMWYRTKKLNQASQFVYQFWTVNGDGVTSPTGASSKIPPMQAFWVRANAGGGTLALTNAMRSHAPATDLLLKAPAAKNTANALVRLQVSNGTNNDETVLYFSANASDGMDTYDAPKMSNDNVAIPEIYTTVGTEQLVINAMNTITLDTPIGLGFVPGNATSFSLTANEISNLPAGVKVILKDNVNSTETDLTDGISTYQFSPLQTSSDRFSVIFRSAGAVTNVEVPLDNSLFVYSNAPQRLTVICNNKINVGSMLSVYNAIGQKLMSQPLTSTSIQIAGKFSPGVYVVKVNNTTKKVIIN